tara:strand:+ start:257 stop:571 length:315 start_codon:yes stop_codon:yes gene_type:complete
MPTFTENTIGGNILQFEWDNKTGVFSKKPEDMTDAQAMDYVNRSREESRQQDPRNQPRMTNEERAAQAFEELERERAKGGQVKKKRKRSKKKPRGWGKARYGNK